MALNFLTAAGKRKQPTETDILRSVRDYLRYNGWFVVRLQQGMGAHKGLSDLVAMKNGITLWLEIKTPIGKLSPHQVQFSCDVKNKGGIYLVIRSVDDIIRELETITDGIIQAAMI